MVFYLITLKIASRLNKPLSLIFYTLAYYIIFLWLNVKWKNVNFGIKTMDPISETNSFFTILNRPFFNTYQPKPNIEGKSIFFLNVL